jgi:hypothetical protein
MDEKRNACNISVMSFRRKRRFGGPRHRFEDNIEIDLKEIGCDGVDWIYLAQDSAHLRPLVNTVMNFVLHERLGMS